MKLNNRLRYYPCTAKPVMYFLCILVVTLPSCKKYLDAKSDSKEEIPSTLTDCQLILANSNAIMNSYPSDGELSSDDFYFSDANFGRLHLTDQQIYEWLPDADRVTDQAPYSYFTPYATILYVNMVLQTLDKLSAADQASIAGKTMKGQALVIRSALFYALAQLYTNPYTDSTALTDPGIPLRLTANITETLTRGTVRQTYDRITGDLTAAIPLLPDNSENTMMPVRTSAYAELARVYLTKGAYDSALFYAKQVLAVKNTLLDYNTVTPNYYSFPTFPNSNPEVIFNAISVNQFLRNSEFVSKELIQAYDSNDLRLTIYFNNNGNGNYYFIGSYNGDQWPFTGLATDEMYLIKAECEARAGNTSDALTDLNTLLINRYKKGTFLPVTATDPADALAKILTERRKELVSRGTRWADLRRLNRDPRFAITQTRTINGTVYTLPPNDPRYTLLIPGVALQYGGYTQNSR